jgi:GTP pyrophosphokinase
MQYPIITPENYLVEIKKINKHLDYQLLEKILSISIEAHKKQKRMSGEAFISHPLHVSYILASMQLDTDTVAAGLMHDILEDTEIRYPKICEVCTKEIADLVEGVTKIQNIPYKTREKQEEVQAENYRKLLVSITKDIRVILIKLADRLHNMRTLNHMTEEQIHRIAQETLDIYVPLANRFGIGKFRWELEDLCLKYLHPAEYSNIAAIVNQNQMQRDNYLKKVIEPLGNNLKKQDLSFEIYGRNKHFYSIYRKHIIRKIAYSEIFDLAAIRIIVDTVPQCYSVLGIVHELYEPIGQFRDYIARPKPNGYQSLHTVVLGPNERSVEVQIRTQAMHWIAEEGIAAHWRYKELKDYSNKGYLQELKTIDLQSSFEQQLVWIRNLLQQQQNENSQEFLEQLKLDLYPEIIVVQTPQNDFIKLPKESTALDFAFAVHTDLGFHTIGAKVNGKFVPMRTSLQSGDIVEALTTKKNNASLDWLDFLKTSRARQKVRSFFRKKELEDAYVLGEELFTKRFRKTKYKIKNISEIDKLLLYFKINDSKTFYTKIGKGELLITDIKQAILVLDSKQHNILDENNEIGSEKDVIQEARQKTKGIRIYDIENLMLNYAKCCNAVPGDKVIGYTTRGRGITIHKMDCKNPGFLYLQKKEPERIINVDWCYDKEGKEQVLIDLDIIGKRRTGFLLEILHKFAGFKIDLTYTNMKSRNNQSIGTFSFYIQNIEEVDKIILELYDVDGVQNIKWTKK